MDVLQHNEMSVFVTIHIKNGRHVWMLNLGSDPSFVHEHIYELPVGTPIQMTNETRPGCWINMIPAGGLLLIPESSAGCTCDYPIQTSMTFMPE